LHFRSNHSRLSQAAIRSSGMWRQEILPSILHVCYFDNISSYSIKILPRIFLIRPRILQFLAACVILIETFVRLYPQTLFLKLSFSTVIKDSCDGSVVPK
jgi:hypothetical protein